MTAVTCVIARIDVTDVTAVTDVTDVKDVTDVADETGVTDVTTVTDVTSVTAMTAVIAHASDFDRGFICFGPSSVAGFSRGSSAVGVPAS